MTADLVMIHTTGRLQYSNTDKRLLGMSRKILADPAVAGPSEGLVILDWLQESYTLNTDRVVEFVRDQYLLRRGLWGVLSGKRAHRNLCWAKPEPYGCDAVCVAPVPRDMRFYCEAKLCGELVCFRRYRTNLLRYTGRFYGWACESCYSVVFYRYPKWLAVFNRPTNTESV
jgi:hypothetical protein